MGEIEYNNSFDKGVPSAIAKYPKLRASTNDLGSFLIGEIDLIDSDGLLRDTYQIQIHPNAAFPYKFPYLYETGGKIPRNIDWHVFEDTGYCCLKAIPEQEVLCYEGIDLTIFIDSEVIPFLFNQTFRRENGYFVRERPHGFRGNLEYYFEILKSTDIRYVSKILTFAVTNCEPDRTAMCFCKSGVKYRKCHKEVMRTIRKITIETLQLDALKILSIIKSFK